MKPYAHHRGYRQCKYCGASLDPGERCDCRDERPENDVVIYAWDEPIINSKGECINETR